MGDWNFADIFERVAARFPSMPAVIDGERTLSWEEFEERAEALAADLRSLSLPLQSKVAVFGRNSHQFLESYVGILKARMVPVNVNWRYGSDELVYLLDNADAAAVVVDAEFIGAAVQIAPRLANVIRWYVVGEGSPPDELPWVPYEGVVARRPSLPVADRVRRRSGDDLIFVYTGGTTGVPKGVMWRQDDVFEALVGSSRKAFGLPITNSVDELVAGIVRPGPRGLSGSPFMHATGLLHQFVMLLAGGTSVVLTGRRFNAGHLWRTVAERGVNAVVIVGDAFALPMLEYLDAHPGELDLSALAVISSSGAIWSHVTKQRLLGHLPWARMYDGLASSEGFGLASTILTTEDADSPVRFNLGAHVRLRTDDGAWVPPTEVGAVGLVAVGGPLPMGYYKDDAKSAETFQVIDGQRYSIPGDYVELMGDGAVRFLGRGSGCINTAGEKVFAEEVEAVVKAHPAVRDAACLGIPDPRFGAAVCVVVVSHDDHHDHAITAEALIAHVKGRLAAYKAPRRVIAATEIPRTAQGKVDHRALRRLVEARLAAS